LRFYKAKEEEVGKNRRGEDGGEGRLRGCGRRFGSGCWGCGHPRKRKNGDKGRVRGAGAGDEETVEKSGMRTPAGLKCAGR